ncbi:LCP family protein [Aquipuribacter sp. SD81]|uniref:LCP family protein n=1 Tax=Aquipuribacter sp. SD81 TaxID=3127703 RepID=UPI00301B1EDE
MRTGDVPGHGADAPRRRSRTARLLRRTVVVLVVLAVLLGVGVAAGDVALRQRYDRNIERFEDPFVALPEAERPPAVEDPAVPGDARNYLLLGSDSRISAGDASQWEYGAQRTDAILLVHVPADRHAVYVVSLPRDTWVAVPGHGDAKINAAFSYGGPALMVQTVEQLTGLRVDHLGVVDFEGFVAMTDALGGVEVTVPETTRDMRAEFPAGTYTMDGEQALDYVRQRYGLDGGDFDRVRRQQNWIRAVLGEALSRDTLTSPSTLDAFLLATTRSVALDEGFGSGELRELAVELRGLRRDDLTFLTVPTDGTARSADGQSIVVLDEAGADGLWAAMRAGTVDEWLATGDADVLGDRVD